MTKTFPRITPKPSSPGFPEDNTIVYLMKFLFCRRVVNLFNINKREKPRLVTFTHIFRGKPITLTIRHMSGPEILAFRKQYILNNILNHPNTDPGNEEQNLNTFGYGEDLIDHMLVGFSGFGLPSKDPLAVTRANKLLIVSLQPGEDEKTLVQVLYDKQLELAAQRKNLQC